MRDTRDTRRSPWRFGVPLVCLLAGLLLAATHGVSGGAEIRRSDAPRLVDLVREAQSSVTRSERRTGCADQEDRLAARPVVGCRTGGDAEAVRRAGRRGGHGPGPRAGPGGDPAGRATRRQRPLPARRVPRRPGGTPARHPGRPQRVVECRCRGDPDAGPAHHRHLGAALRRQHAIAQRAHLQPALHDHRDRQCRRHAGGSGRRSPGDPLQAVRGPVRPRLPARTSSPMCGSSAIPNRSACISLSRWARWATDSGVVR